MKHVQIRPEDVNLARFFVQTEATPWPGCRLWTGLKNENGYGVTTVKRRKVLAPRVAWVVEHQREIPDGMLVCHRCDNPSCVLPDHLFLGTQADNVRDMIRKGRKAPCVTPTGDQHWTRRHPTRLARGDANGARLYPERLARGERQGSAKLTEAVVIAILADQRSSPEIAAQYGVNRKTVWLVKSGKSWCHIPRPAGHRAA